VARDHQQAWASISAEVLLWVSAQQVVVLVVESVDVLVVVLDFVLAAVQVSFARLVLVFLGLVAAQVLLSLLLDTH